MGSEDLFHKRRKTASKKLERGRKKRDPYLRILIVCEGEKTEPNYLAGMIDHLKLNTANVEVDGSCGSSPNSIWLYAQERYFSEEHRGDNYDKIYCVFDKDSHTTYEATVQAIKAFKPNKVFHAITSVPCFEYWILLHWQYTTQEFHGVGNNSSCDNVINQLKVHMPNYSKGDQDIFNEIMGQTNYAIANSERAFLQAQQVNTDNPTTLMHQLVKELYCLKIKPDKK